MAIHQEKENQKEIQRQKHGIISTKGVDILEPQGSRDNQ